MEQTRIGSYGLRCSTQKLILFLVCANPLVLMETVAKKSAALVSSSVRQHARESIVCKVCIS